MTKLERVTCMVGLQELLMLNIPLLWSYHHTGWDLKWPVPVLLCGLTRHPRKRTWVSWALELLKRELSHLNRTTATKSEIGHCSSHNFFAVWWGSCCPTLPVWHAATLPLCASHSLFVSFSLSFMWNDPPPWLRVMGAHGLVAHPKRDLSTKKKRGRKE